MSASDRNAAGHSACWPTASEDELCGTAIGARPGLATDTQGADHMNSFSNRAEAGQRLAELLAGRNDPDPVVLALPRGGVPVALEVARRLKAPLDLIMVRKLGVPTQPELAAGAVVDGDQPQVVVNEDVVRGAGLSQKALDELAEAQLEEIRRRRAIYLKGRAAVPVAGRTAIIVDDGIATGATIRAALRATRQRNPARIVLAVPVAPPDTLELLRPEANAIVCVETPDVLWAIGAHYADFAQVGDDEVVQMLAEADRSNS